MSVLSKSLGISFSFIFFSSAEVSDGEVEEEGKVEDELKLREEAEARLRYAQNCKH